MNKHQFTITLEPGSNFQEHFGVDSIEQFAMGLKTFMSMRHSKNKVTVEHTVLKDQGKDKTKIVTRKVKDLKIGSEVILSLDGKKKVEGYFQGANDHDVWVAKNHTITRVAPQDIKKVQMVISDTAR